MQIFKKLFQTIYQVLSSYQKLNYLKCKIRRISCILGILLKTGLPLMKNVLQPLAKSVSIPLGLTAAASAADAGINQKVLRSGRTKLIIFK